MAGPTQGVALKLKLRRASMNFKLKLRISDYVGASSLLYGCIKVLAVGPIYSESGQWISSHAMCVCEMLDRMIYYFKWNLPNYIQTLYFPLPATRGGKGLAHTNRAQGQRFWAQPEDRGGN